MEKPTLRMRIRRFCQFLSARVVSVLFIGVLGGVLLSIVELAMAYGLQLFLQTLGLPVMAMGNGFLSRIHWSANGALLFLFSIAMIRALIIWVQNFLQNATSDYYTHEQRKRLLDFVFSTYLASTRRMTTLFNERCTMSCQTIAGLQVLLLNLTTSLIIGAALFRLSIKTTSFALVLMVFSAYPAAWLGKRIQHTAQGIVDQWDKTNARLLSSIKNIILLRIYGVQKRENEIAQSDLQAYTLRHLRYHRFSGFNLVSPQIVGIFLLCMIMTIGRSFFNLQSTVIVSYFYLFLRFAQTLSAGNHAISQMQLGWPHLRDLYQWWDRDYVPQQIVLKKQESSLGAQLQVTQPLAWRLSHVNFQYPGTERPTLKDLTLDIPAAAFTAIMGPSGAGKSTFLNLLIGFYQPSEGTVQAQINGDYRALSGIKINSAIGYVGTDPFIKEGTVFDNITYGLHKLPSDEDIRHAVRQAECDFVYDLPNGLRHHVTEQSQGLSAGQLQRLALVRALLRRPQALILDEATSNLDPVTEQRILTTLAAMKKTLTIVAVTHRESLLAFADHVIHIKGNA